MNRLVTENLRDVGPDRLPPRHRQGPARVLFINHNLLGHITHAQNITTYTRSRDDIDAVHIDVVRPLWLKVANKSLPVVGHWDLRHFRCLLLWRPVLRQWFSGPLDPAHFDVIHFLSSHYAWGPLELRREGRVRNIRVAVNLDCTAGLFHRELGWPWASQKPVSELEQWIVGESDLVFSMSEWTARSIVEDYGVAPRKVQLLRGCGSRAATDLARAASARTCTSALPRIVFVGNDWVRK